MTAGSPEPHATIMRTFDIYRQTIGALVRMRPYLRGGRGLILAVVITAVLGCALEGIGVGLLIPLLSLLLGGENASPMRPLAWLQQAWPGQSARAYVGTLSGVIVLAILTKNAVLYVSQRLTARLKRRISTHLRAALHNRVLRAEFHVFEHRGTGEAANLLATETFRTLLAIDYLLLVLQRGCMALFYLLALTLLRWELLALTLAAGGVIRLTASFLYRRLVRAGQTLTEANVELARTFVQTYAGIRVIRATHAEEAEARRFARVNTAQAAAEEAGVRLSQLMTPLVETAGVIAAMGIVTLAYGWLVQPGTMPPSHLLGYGFILVRLLPLANQIHAIQGNLATLLGSLHAVERWLQVPIHPRQPFGNRPFEGVHQGLHFDQVSFQYPAGTQALHQVSFTARAGQVTAIVGPSGSGKSTLAALLLRFHEPGAGRITLDGIDIREFRPDAWHRHVALVEQHTFVFHDTLARNIAFGCESCTREDIERAATAAHLDETLARLPQGLDSEVGEAGSRLSGGQRQRIAIARALLRKPAILILDEATSALDSVSEQQIQSTLSEAAAGRTVLVIAHRLSTVRQAHWIVVVNHGRVEEQGDWATLERNGRLFARLAAEPAGGGAGLEAAALHSTAMEPGGSAAR